MAAAWLAFLTYTAAQIAVITYLGLTLGAYVDDLVGVDLPWWVWSLSLVVLIGVLGYRHVGRLKRTRPSAYRGVIDLISE